MRKISLLLLIICFAANSPAQTYLELFDQALNQIEQDQWEEAEKLFYQALKAEPSNPHSVLIFSNLGTIQRHMGKYDDAIDSYTYALNFSPQAVPILLNRATLLMELGKTDRAYIDYCQVLDVDKSNAEALLMRAYIYVVRRDYKAARLDYERLLGIEPDSYNGRLGLITLNQKEKKYSDAIEMISRLIVEYPEDATLYIARADIEADMGHIDLAFIDLDEAIRLAPELPDSFLLRGDLYLSQKRKALAKADFEKAIQLGVPQSELHKQMQQCK